MSPNLGSIVAWVTRAMEPAGNRPLNRVSRTETKRERRIRKQNENKNNSKNKKKWSLLSQVLSAAVVSEYSPENDEFAGKLTQNRGA